MMHGCRRPHGEGSSVSRLLPSRIISPLNDTLKKPAMNMILKILQSFACDVLADKRVKHASFVLKRGGAR